MTMQPKQIKALLLNQLDPGDSGDASASGDASFTSEGSSTTGSSFMYSPHKSLFLCQARDC